MYLQQVGRGLRPAANKDKLIILDNVGLYYRFGFPSARRHWRHHFEGQDVDYTSIPGVTEEEEEEEEERDVKYFDKVNEGEEMIEMLHSSIEENVDDIQNEGPETPENEAEFKHYMLNILEADVVHYKKILRGLKMDVDNMIKRKYDHSHQPVFYINDTSSIDLYLTDFQIDPSMSEIDAEKGGIMSESLKLYRGFLLWKESDSHTAPEEEPLHAVSEETIAPRSLEEVELGMKIFKKYRSDIPQELQKEFERLTAK